MAEGLQKLVENLQAEITCEAKLPQADLRRRKMSYFTYTQVVRDRKVS